MTVPSVHCEARKIAYRQSRDGLVVSFVIHPNEIPAELALAPLGQRYMLTLAAIGDDEKPVERSATFRYEDSFGPPCPWLPARDTKVAVRVTASERGKQRYVTASDMEKALVRAVLLPKDARFQQWVIESHIIAILLSNEEASADFIRVQCCAGESRKLIAEDRLCYEAFVRMETSYLIETGVLAEPR